MQLLNLYINKYLINSKSERICINKSSIYANIRLRV
nr:MAG TPA: hypothetical protein [Caudoviricetes sp.]